MKHTVVMQKSRLAIMYLTAVLLFAVCIMFGTTTSASEAKATVAIESSVQAVAHNRNAKAARSRQCIWAWVPGHWRYTWYGQRWVGGYWTCRSDIWGPSR